MVKVAILPADFILFISGLYELKGAYQAVSRGIMPGSKAKRSEVLKNNLLGRFVLLLIIIFVVSGFSGCKKDSPVSTEEDHPDWPDLSEKEDVIETIRLCFQYYDKVPLSELEEHYRNILYQEDDKDFMYYPAPELAGPGDVDPGEDSIMSLVEFVDAAVYLWGNALALTLYISPGTWGERLEIEGCDDCFPTTRTYQININIVHDGDIYEIARSNYIVEFIVRPHHDDPEKWAIYRIYGISGM